MQKKRRELSHDESADKEHYRSNNTCEDSIRHLRYCVAEVITTAGSRG